MKIIPKVWGREEWLGNNDKYCGKLLFINKNAISSLHRHLIKQETFYCLSGEVELEVDNDVRRLTHRTPAVTLNPGMWHRFKGITEAELLEISTHHEDTDVERKEESQC